jgi:hypothetical protein
MSTDQVLFGVGLILALAVGSQVLASRLRIPALIILLPAGFTVSALTTDVNPGAPAEASSIAVLAVAVGALVVVLAFNVVVFRWAVQVSSKLDAGYREGVRFPAGRARDAARAQRTGRRRRDSSNNWSLSRRPAPSASGL